MAVSYGDLPGVWPFDGRGLEDPGTEKILGFYLCSFQSLLLCSSLSRSSEGDREEGPVR